MNYYNQIKEELINNEIYKKAKDYSKNRSDLSTYYNVGKLLVEAQGGKERAKYGDSLIKEYSKKLTKDLGKGYSIRSLKNMRKFYLFQKGQAVPAQLSWSHYCELLTLKNKNEINYYINITINQNLSYRQLHNIIKNKYRADKISEKMLQTLILEDLPSFLDELGKDFSFVRNEYKIKIGNNYNYIDLLLYNIKYKCYVVIELKVTELKKEHIGQIEIYMNYIDKHVRKYDDGETIGIIICKKENKFVIAYTSDKRILQRYYVLN